MIEVGEYVRTKTGIIGKIQYVEYVEIDKGHKVLDECTFDRPIYYEYGEGYYRIYDDEEFEEVILNHSKNIIDLIQPGDYVNGYKIVNIEKEYYNLNLDKVLPLKNPNLIIGNEEGLLTINEILSIVTKEQFKSIEYKVGE